MDLVKELNDKQLEAVTTNDKYVRIIAGAGSGKTRVLTYRIAYLISEMHVDPYNILAITFTNKVANEMKSRMSSLVEGVNLNDLRISTFHARCAYFLRHEIKVFDFPSSFMILDDSDQERLVKNIGAVFGYRKSDEKVDRALNFIRFNKMEGKLPSDLVKDKLSPQDKDSYDFFVEYEKKKNEMFELDFDDLIIYAVRILDSFEEIRDKYSSRYRFILVDEFQDTDDQQYQLLKMLCGSDTSLMVVGDPDQTIYTWRGANQRIIMKIDEDFSPMKTIILNQNYRSTASILNASNQLIAKNKERIPKDLFTIEGNGEPIVFSCYNDGVTEANGIASTILSMKKKDPSVNFSDFAILYRSSYLSLPVEKAMTANKISYAVYGGTRFYERKEVKDCIAYFRLIVNPLDDISFQRIVNVPSRKIGEVSQNALISEAREAGLSIENYIREIHRHDTSLTSRVINPLNDLFEKMDKARNRLSLNFEATSAVLQDFLEEIGYFHFMTEDDEMRDKVDNVKTLIEDIKNFTKDNPNGKLLDYLENVSLLSSQDEIADIDKTVLMTVHTAKGLEFKYVFVIGMAEGVFPNYRASLENSSAKMEEERRLAYVAFTRAKKKLFLSYNKSYSAVAQGYLRPSKFLKEAGIEVSNDLNYQGFHTENDRGGERNVYRSRFMYGAIKEEKSRDRSKNVIDVDTDNGIKWCVGDIALHRAFGEGKVISVEGDIIDVDFVDFGVKKLLANHPMLSKKKDGAHE
jgi:DNA helicase-2/ATP-dependent DNA helicase PcrA